MSYYTKIYDKTFNGNKSRNGRLDFTKAIGTGANRHILEIFVLDIQNVNHQRISEASKYLSSHPATFFVKVLPVGIGWEDLSRMFPDSEVQLTPAFIGGGRV